MHVSSSAHGTEIVTEAEAKGKGDDVQQSAEGGVGGGGGGGGGGHSAATLALDIGASPGGWSRFLAENVGCRCVLAVGGFFAFFYPGFIYVYYIFFIYAWLRMLAADASLVSVVFLFIFVIKL
jgi:hypothetical protein